MSSVNGAGTFTPTDISSINAGDILTYNGSVAMTITAISNSSLSVSYTYNGSTVEVTLTR